MSDICTAKYRELSNKLASCPSEIGYLMSCFSLSRLNYSYGQNAEQTFPKQLINYTHFIDVALNEILGTTNTNSVSSFLPSITQMLDHIFENEGQPFVLEEILQCTYKLITQLNGTTTYSPEITSSIIVSGAQLLLDVVDDYDGVFLQKDMEHIRQPSNSILLREILRIDDDLIFLHGLHLQKTSYLALHKRCELYQQIDIFKGI